MKDLLPYFESELSHLRGSVDHFAREYPKIAGRLALGADAVEDPHVERLVQSFALLTARVHKRLDDDFPLFVESLLQVLYPHYLQPFPSCSIAQFDLGSGAGALSTRGVIGRGTQLTSQPARGVACKFRTAYDVTLAPLRLTSASYRHSVGAPEGTPLPAGSTAVISVKLELQSTQFDWKDLGGTLRVYLDGEASLVSALREALCHRVTAVMVQAGAHAPWSGPHPQRPELVGFAADEALIDHDERSHPAYRLLTEYFAYPEKFNFLDLPVPAPRRAAPGDTPVRAITLHFVLAEAGVDEDQSRLLESLSAKNLQLGCTPVVNLFAQHAEPVRVTHTKTQYPVVVDARRAHGYDVYSIDKVYRVKQTPQGESIDTFQPFFSLQHDDLLSANDAPGHKRAGRYWQAHRDEAVAALSPGYETELSIVDIDFNPCHPQTDTLSIQLTATNRDLPSLLAIGQPGGDMTVQGGSLAREIRLLRKPTPSHRFERGRGSLWRLVSHLSLNHLSLSGRGIDALREMLRLYDLPRDAANRRQVDGLAAIDFKPATAWLPGKPFATFVRGTEVRLSVDEQSFVGTGLGLFAAVLDHFFGLYVQVNSFSQLTILSSRTQKVLFSCPARNGANPLV
jgi:type VI secretion system protein ImpG